MNQLLFDIDEIPLIKEPDTIRQNKIMSMIGFCKEYQSDEEYKYIYQEFDNNGLYTNFEKYNAQGKLVCKRDFDNEGKMLSESHFIGEEELEFQYSIDYEPDKIIKVMRDPQGIELARTIISITSSKNHYRLSNYNKKDELISELEYIYKNGSRFPDIISKTRGEYSFKEEGTKITLIESLTSAPKNNPGIVYSGNSKLLHIEKEGHYIINFQINTF